MTKDDIISRSFSVITNPMSALGLYPPEQESTFYTLRAYMLYIFLMVLTVILIAVNLIREENPDLVELNFMCVYVTEAGFCALKILFFISNRHRVKNCINYFAQPRFQPINEEGKKIIEDCVNVCQKICKVYLYGIIVAAFLWLLPSWIAKEEKLPISIWLPYDPYSSPKLFYSTLTYVSIATTYNGLSSTLTDPVVGSLSYHATTQLKVLKHNLQNLHNLIDLTTDITQNEYFIRFERAYKILKRCVDHHNDILEFLREFENCFSVFVFCQLAGSIFSLCFCCIGITLVTSNIDVLRFLAFYLLLMFQIFFYFFFGTLLYEENNGFLNAICEGPWDRYDSRIRKFLIIMMERSRKPMIITAGKMVNLTLSTFTTILKTSYSLVAVLKNFQ